MKAVFASLVILLVFANTVFAERVVSLDEAINIALRDNPEIKAFDNSVSAGREDIGIARSYLLPKLTFEERFIRTNNPTFAFSAKLNQERFTQADFAINSLNDPDPINDFQTSLSFEQPVFVRQASLGLKMAKKEAEALQLDFQRKKEKVALDVIKTFLNVQTAKAYVKAAEKGLEDAKEHKRIAEARFNSGLGLYSDILRTDVFQKEAEERLIKAKKNLQVAKRALGLMLGLSESVDVTEETPDLTSFDIEAYSSAALQRSDIKALEQRLKNAENAIKLASAGYLPVVGIGGSYQWNDHDKAFGSEGESYQVMAFLRWNLFDGTKREHEKKKAEYKVKEVSEYLDGFKKEVLFRVYEAYLGVEEARKSLELAKARKASAEEGVRLLKARYENALSTIVELLDAQASLDAARAGVIEKNNNYLIAVSELKFQSGLILKNH
jgi:outer membrane protein TolC